MITYRSVLKAKLKETGLSQRQIATAMGWGNQATVSLRLTGKRDWAEGELAKMCELAGVTIIELAATSDDMPGFTRRKDTVVGAAILDRLPNNQFNAVMAMLRELQSGGRDA